MGIRLSNKTYGQLGEAVFTEVQRLTESEGLTRSAAFRRIAEETGRSVGSVTVNFYRIAKRRGLKVKRSGRKRGATPVAGRRRAVSATAGKAGSLIQQLQQLIEQQQRDIETLREENTRFAEIRRLLLGAGSKRS